MFFMFFILLQRLPRRKNFAFIHEGDCLDVEALNTIGMNETTIGERPVIIASLQSAFLQNKHHVTVILQHEKRESNVQDALFKYSNLDGKWFTPVGSVQGIKRGEPCEIIQKIEAARHTNSFWSWNPTTGIQGHQLHVPQQTSSGTHHAVGQLSVTAKLQQTNEELARTKTELVQALDKIKNMEIINEEIFNMPIDELDAPDTTPTTTTTRPNCSKELADSQAQINELQATLQQKNHELAEAKKTKRPLTTNDLMAKRPGQESIGDLKAKLKTANYNVDRLEAQLATVTSTIKAHESEITKYKALDYKTAVANTEEAALRLELDNLKAKNADLEAQIKQCKDDFLAFALNELRGNYDCVRTCITPIEGKVYTDSDYRDLIRRFSSLVKPNGIIVQQLEKEISELKAAAIKRLSDSDTAAHEHRMELEKANTFLQAQVTAQSNAVQQATANAERARELEHLLAVARAETQTMELMLQSERHQFTEEKAEMETRLATAKLLIDEAGGNPNHIRLSGNAVYNHIKEFMAGGEWHAQTEVMLKHPLSQFGISYQLVQQGTHAKENERLKSKIIRLEATINRHTAVVADLQQQLTESKKHASSLQCAIDGYNIERLRTGWQVAPTYVPGVNQVVAANIVAALKDMTALVKAAGYEISKEINDCKKLKAHEMNVQEAIVFIKELKRQHPSNQAANISLDTVHTALTRSRQVFCIHSFFSFLFFQY